MATVPEFHGFFQTGPCGNGWGPRLPRAGIRAGTATRPAELRLIASADGADEIPVMGNLNPNSIPRTTFHAAYYLNRRETMSQGKRSAGEEPAITRVGEPRRRVTVAPLSRRTVAAKLHAASPEGVWHTGRAKRLLRAAALRWIRHQTSRHLVPLSQHLFEKRLFTTVLIDDDEKRCFDKR